MLVHRYQELAFRAAFLITRDAGDAEEACQEGFVKAHRALDRFREDEPFRPWLLKIVTNQARNRRRSAGRRHALAIKAGGMERQGEPSLDDHVIAAEDRVALLSAIEVLPRRDQEVITYRYFLDLSVSETAVALNVPTGTVKSRLARALARLEGTLNARSGSQGGRS